MLSLRPLNLTRRNEQMNIPASAPVKLLVIANTCEQHIHDLRPGDDLLEAAREYCTPCNCLVCVYSRDTPIVRMERAPGTANRWSSVMPARPRRRRSYRLRNL
ncbi:hypothetical protein AVE81_003844 [Salmonella enterica subsp. diarizonae]|nr:hypothetical protein [Salmonella enterica subsp. diarizonae]